MTTAHLKMGVETTPKRLVNTLHSRIIQIMESVQFSVPLMNQELSHTFRGSVSQAVKKILVFYGILMFSIVFTKSYIFFILSYFKSVECLISGIFKIHFNIIFLSTPATPPEFSRLNFVHLLSLSHILLHVHPAYI
jgi:hypothetical protein